MKSLIAYLGRSYSKDNRNRRLILNIKVLFIFIFLPMSFLNTYGSIKEKDIIPFEPSLIGSNINEAKNKGVAFDNVFPEKRGELLNYAKFPNTNLWDFALFYSKNRAITSITYIVSKDFAKAKKECPEVIKFLINKFGKNFQVKYATLNSSISTEKGYSIIWDKGLYLIIIKFGPLIKTAKKFHLQLTLTSNKKQINEILGSKLKSSSVENDKEILKELTDYFGDNIGITK